MTNFLVFSAQSASDTLKMSEDAAEQRYHANHKCTPECGPQWYEDFDEENPKR